MNSSRILSRHLLGILFLAQGFVFGSHALAQTVDVQAPELSEDAYWDDSPDTEESGEVFPFVCRKASGPQLAQVNKGNAKIQDFLNACASATEGSPWCQQLIRPNPASVSIFRCTYGETQSHTLVHPDPQTWANAFQAVRLVEELEANGAKPCLIYNWWRPEPYNANVGGAPGRHPFGTSIDVRFCSMNDMERAFTQLCKWRKEGRLRALGYYGSTALHFGIGDRAGNTWGKNCP